MTLLHPSARYSLLVRQRIRVALGAAAALAAISLSPGSAQAHVVTVGGVQYDVTTFTGSYDANTSKFATAANGGVMPWWGSSSNATAFAIAVGTKLGTPNPPLGPLFAHSFDPAYDPEGTGSYPTVFYASFYNNTTYASTMSPSDPFAVYAQATLYTSPAPAPVPAPLPLLGSAAALSFCRRLSSRSKRLRHGASRLA